MRQVVEDFAFRWLFDFDVVWLRVGFRLVLCFYDLLIVSVWDWLVYLRFCGGLVVSDYVLVG